MKIESLNSAYKHLTNKQQKQIDVATEKINVKMLKNLDYGEDLLVSENVVLSHYCEYEIITLNIEDEWIEVFQIMYDTDTNKIVIEIL
tara:strand:+ start:318 stop:581 length:264 start_codon:yes stop_codon:yes gene_type:complete